MKQFTSMVTQDHYTDDMFVLWISHDGRQSTGLTELSKSDLQNIARTIHQHLGEYSEMLDCNNPDEVVDFIGSIG